MLMILLTVFMALSFDRRIFYLGIAFVFVYLSVFLLSFLFQKKGLGDKGQKGRLTESASSRFLSNLNIPVAILDEDGVILWYNRKFSEIRDKKVLEGTNINDLLETKFNLNHLKESLSGETDTDSLNASMSGVKYKVYSYLQKNTSMNKNTYFTVWYDLTDINRLTDELVQRNPVVMYIYIDNFYDAGGTMVSNYRTVTAKVSALLYDWIASHHGIVREFERDKFFAVVSREEFNSIAESKFDILDKVRELAEKEMDMLATLSIGVACLSNPLFDEKNSVAHQALDLAVQRGGDQAVVKLDDSTEYYGGRFKTVQKRTKIRSRIIAQELVALIANSSNVLVMGHKYSDHDSIGACVGIAKLALEYNPNVNIIINKRDPNFQRLYGKITSMDKYNNVFVDAYAGQDLISPQTLLIICDVNNSAIFESKDIYENVKDVVVIDHHRKTGEFIAEPKITYIEPSASSASEIVSEMLEQITAPGSLLKEEAELLFAGIVLDTKQFAKNTGVRTFSAALYLRSEGASPSEITSMFKSSFDDFSRESRFMNNVAVYRDIFAISALQEEADANDKISASRVADKLLEIAGVCASFALCTIDGTIHISARSTGTVNVQLILEKLNGGGHFDSAGAQVSGVTLEDTFQLLKTAIDEYLESTRKEG